MTNNQETILILAKGGEKYIFAYDDASRKALLGVFGRFAADSDLSFSWHDAAVLSKKVREKKAGLVMKPGLRINSSYGTGG